VTEAKWLARPRHAWPRLCAMIRFLERHDGNRRRLRLFASACCRGAWDLLRLGGARGAVELAEAWADGEVSGAQLAAAHGHPDFARLEAELSGEGAAEIGLSYCVVAAIRAARALASPSPDIPDIARATSLDLARDFPVDSGWARSGEWRGVRPDEAALGGHLRALRDIFGNPFRPAGFDPRWRTAEVTALARGIYEDRALDQLPVLADALMDAGCADDAILEHCGLKGPHVRGCWVVDLARGKG